MASTPSAHKRFSPSQAERFFTCPGSTALIARTPSRHERDYAQEGTEAHSYIEFAIRNKCRTYKELRAVPPYDQKQYEKETTFIVAINDTLDYVWMVFDELNTLYGDAHVFFETFVDVPVDSAPGEAGGTLDLAITSKIGRQIYLIDFKFGIGIDVRAKDNKQVKQYGAGAIYGANKLIDAADVDEVHIVILQPRSIFEAGELDEYTTTPGEILEYLFELDEAIANSLAPDAPLNPHKPACQFCPAKGVCPALISTTSNAIVPGARTLADLPKDKMPDPRNMTEAQLSYAMRMLPLINLWIKDVEQFASERLKDGHNIPGYKIVEAKAKREWHGEPDAIAGRLASLIGCPPEDLFKKKFINITDAEKLVKAAFKKNVTKKRRKAAAEDAGKAFAYFTTKKSSGNLTVVPESDSRPAVNNAQRKFGDVGNIINQINKETTQ